MREEHEDIGIAERGTAIGRPGRVDDLEDVGARARGRSREREGFEGLRGEDLESARSAGMGRGRGREGGAHEGGRVGGGFLEELVDEEEGAFRVVRFEGGCCAWRVSSVWVQKWL